MQGMDLRGSNVRIERTERAHRLDRNGRATADLDTTDGDLSGISHFILLWVINECGSGGSGLALGACCPLIM